MEASVKRVVSGIRFLVNNRSNRKRQWHSFLPFIQFHMNAQPQVSSGLSAYEIVYGKQPLTPFSLKTLLPSTVSIDRRLKVLEEIRQSVISARQKAQATYKSKYDSNRKDISYKVGSPVFVWFERKASLAFPKKLQKLYRIGTVYKKVSNLLYIIKLRTKTGCVWKRLTHVTHLKPSHVRPGHLSLKSDAL